MLCDSPTARLPFSAVRPLTSDIEPPAGQIRSDAAKTETAFVWVRIHEHHVFRLRAVWDGRDFRKSTGSLHGDRPSKVASFWIEECQNAETPELNGLFNHHDISGIAVLHEGEPARRGRPCPIEAARRRWFARQRHPRRRAFGEIFMIPGPLQDLLYARLAKMKDDQAAVGRAFFAVTRGLAIIVFPTVGMVAAAHQAVFDLLLSTRWESAGYLFMIVAPAFALQVVSAIGGTVRMVLGRTDIMLRTTVEVGVIRLITLLMAVCFGLDLLEVLTGTTS